MYDLCFCVAVIPRHQNVSVTVSFILCFYFFQNKPFPIFNISLKYINNILNVCNSIIYLKNIPRLKHYIDITQIIY